jgi:hypothetical protein
MARADGRFGLDGVRVRFDEEGVGLTSASKDDVPGWTTPNEVVCADDGGSASAADGSVHWLVVDLPAGVTALREEAALIGAMPAGAPAQALAVLR